MFAYVPRFARVCAAVLTLSLLTGCSNFIFKTFDIDEDVLQVGKELAPEANQSLVRNGVPLLSVQPGARPITSQIVAELQENEE